MKEEVMSTGTTVAAVIRTFILFNFNCFENTCIIASLVSDHLRGDPEKVIA